MDNVLKRAYLVLADGKVFNGYSMGIKGETIGEVVFNTCTSSYQSILSDPTYYGQIVAQTYPLVGNRGIEDDDERTGIAANGYIVREWCDNPYDIHGGKTLDEYLKSNNIVGICGIDTRRLTRTLRDKGYFNGAITDTLENFDKLLTRIKSYSIHGAAAAVTIRESYDVNTDNAEYNVVVIDYGCQNYLLKALTERHCNIKVVSAALSADEIIAMKPDGIVFSNGPGDPDDDIKSVETIKKLLNEKIPSLGIVLGHQMMVLALGGLIQKMPKGHRGSNQPVRICGTDKIMITLQNHGYDVARGSLPDDVAETVFININDGSIEGFRYLKFPGISVQFTPIDDKNYSETAWIYDEFIKLIKEAN